MWLALGIALAVGAIAAPASGPSADPLGERTAPDRPPKARVEWRDSVALGSPAAGRLVRGVRLPAAGGSFFTWDPVLKRSPNRDWRRWGADEVVRATLRVARELRRRHPKAQRIGIGDLSLPEGGYFGPEVGGGIGHATHQNGLDVDVYYPRRDRRERAPTAVGQVDVARSQELVDLFLAAGATTIYVGPSLPLTGPPGIVIPLANHDNHLHARFAP